MIGCELLSGCSVGLQSWVEHLVTCLDESLGCAAELLLVTAVGDVPQVANGSVPPL